jgi:hypothetical protein
MNNDIEQRAMAFVEAVAAWRTMRNAMERAQPRTQHDCWFTVGEVLGNIAQNILQARETARVSAALQEPPFDRRQKGA